MSAPIRVQAPMEAQAPMQGSMQMPPQMSPQAQIMPVQQPPMQQAMEVFGNRGDLRFRHMPHDYHGKTPEGCTKTNHAYRVNTFVYGTNNGVMYFKEDNTVVNQCSAPCSIDEENANQTVRLFSSVDEFNSQELYRYYTPAPKMGSFCPNDYIEYQTQVMSTKPNQPMKIVGDSRVKYNFKGCCGTVGYQDVEVINKETGARYNIEKIPFNCMAQCSNGDFELAVTNGLGQQVGTLSKQEDAKVGCSRWDFQYPTLTFRKNKAMSDDDQALLLAGSHQNYYMTRFMYFIQGCGLRQLWGYTLQGMKHW